MLDPVRGASVGGTLLDDHARRALLEGLIPRSDLLTPNFPEAAWLSGGDAAEVSGVSRLIPALHALGARHVLLKGGHAEGEDKLTDWLSATGGALRAFEHPRQPGRFRGTGCALASAVAALLAYDCRIETACASAIALVQDSMRRAIEPVAGAPRCLRPSAEALHVARKL